MGRASRLAESFTVGVEEEYQLVDAVAGGLRSRARHVLAFDWSEEIRGELQETTLEVGTRVCATMADVERELKRLRLQVAATAAAQELRIIAAGVHPFSRWEGHARSSEARYARIEREYGRIARDEHNFGMHIHVAVPANLDRIALLNVVRGYIPHLIALCCSSPFYEGEDTGYASYRLILWRRWPGNGVPPRLGSAAEYRRYADLLLRAGAITDERGLYWSVRPHPVYPTLEFRAMDACPRVEDAAAVAALARALVVAAALGRLEEWAPAGFSPEAVHALLAENEWRAARAGLEGWLIAPESAEGRRPLQAAIRELAAALAPTLVALGDGEALGRIDALLERGNAADRMRRVYRESGDVGVVVRWLAAETLLGVGMDRRREQRGELAA
ncbi:MAG TPA: YbdK family carboxylate-amine ligase [Longimicrobiales bacterium]